MALVADLHGCEPEPALQALEQLAPDMILIAGDLMERRERAEAALEYRNQYGRWMRAALTLFQECRRPVKKLLGKNARENENALAFIKGAVRIAPTYYALGNHELSFQEEDRRRTKAAGAILLENRALYTHGLWLGGLTCKPDEAFLQEFAAKKGFKVLLCHRPEYFDTLLAGLDIQLILAGHAHGGQICLGKHGLFAPGQGFFPKYTGGVYDGRLVVSRGMANHTGLPRIHNPMELVMIQLDPDAARS